MNGEIWVAVLVGVLSSVITGGAGLAGIVWSIRNSDKHRALDASRATHDTAVGACEAAWAWIERSQFLLWELIADNGDEGGSEYVLSTPWEIYQELDGSAEDVRSALYRVAMGNADSSVREKAYLLRGMVGQLSEALARTLQDADRVDWLRELAGKVQSLQTPLRELEAAMVKAIGW